MVNGEIFNYGCEKLTVCKALKIAEGESKGAITKKAIKQIERGKNAVDEIVKEEKTVYGINTGFGPLCTTKISPEETRKLQYNILRSHSVGVGEKIPDKIAKLILILKVHTFAMGYSGVSLQTVERILWHIENNIFPVIPSQGSVGASGDLAPLAHAFLPLIGLGKIR